MDGGIRDLHSGPLFWAVRDERVFGYCDKMPSKWDYGKDAGIYSTRRVVRLSVVFPAIRGCRGDAAKAIQLAELRGGVVPAGGQRHGSGQNAGAAAVLD